MKKSCFNIVLLISATVLFSHCGRYDTEMENPYAQKEEMILPENSRLLGVSLAKELNETVRNMHKAGIDYSRAKDSEEFKERFCEDFLAANPNAKKTRANISEYRISPTEFARRRKSLTKIQLTFIERIINESRVCVSDEDFCNRLMNINKDIYATVPEIQQERLFNITSVLYYCIKEIQELEKQGLMFPTPQNTVQRTLIKTRSEGVSGSYCRTFLATTWAIAVGEPTPVGEIVAFVATVYMLGELMYEVTVCRENREELHEYCVEHFEDCWPKYRDHCSDCLQYCETQGVWPSTLHNC